MMNMKMSKRQNLAINNTEFRTLLAECYGGHGLKKRFSDETGISQQTVSSWWGDRSEVRHIVILFLRDRAAIARLAGFVGQWAAQPYDR